MTVKLCSLLVYRCMCVRSMCAIVSCYIYESGYTHHNRWSIYRQPHFLKQTARPTGCTEHIAHGLGNSPDLDNETWENGQRKRGEKNRKLVTRNKKLLGAKGIASSNKNATRCY